LSYFESRLKVDFENIDQIKSKLNFCHLLGIKNLILEPTNNVKSITTELKERIEKITSINVYYRFNLKPRSLNDFKRILKNYIRFPHILSIESSNKEIQIQAAKDSRIDIISFSDQELMKTISPGVISLTKQNNSFIEFSLASIMVNNKAIQSKNFRNLYRFIQMVLGLKANYVISGNFEEIYNLRHPRALISICHTLLGMPIIKAKRGFYENVLRLINKAQSRLDKDFIEQGVRLLKGGDEK